MTDFWKEDAFSFQCSRNLISSILCQYDNSLEFDSRVDWLAERAVFTVRSSSHFSRRLFCKLYGVTFHKTIFVLITVEPQI